jgi:hypothetical protein
MNNKLNLVNEITQRNLYKILQHDTSDIMMKIHTKEGSKNHWLILHTSPKESHSYPYNNIQDLEEDYNTIINLIKYRNGR